MTKDEWQAHGLAAAEAAGAEMPEPRRRVRMTRAPGQTVVLCLLGALPSAGAAAAHLADVEIRLAGAETGEVATLDFLLPDGFFVEYKETLDGVRALFCGQSLPLAEG